MSNDSNTTLNILRGPITTERWIHYLDTVARLPYIQARKREVMERLQLHDGDIVLDAGCGTGDDVREMAAHVGPNGRFFSSVTAFIVCSRKP